MRLGIDFGTTNSAVALYDGANLYGVEIDPTSENSDILPSLIYLTRDYDTHLGLEAMREYAKNETGRSVKWRKKLIGAFEVTVAGPGSGPIVFMQDAYAFYDDAAFGRLLQSVKTALRNPTYQGTQIFDRFFTLDELIAILLKSLRISAETQFEQPCTELVLGRPVRFSHDPAVDRRAEEVLFKAARWAGFENIRFQPEPIGATFLYHIHSEDRQRVLVFDFGGGTLDFTIADVGAGIAPEIIATHGVLVGGDDLDKRIMESLLKYFGAGLKIGNQPFPYEILDMLLNWQTMPDVSRPEYRDVLYDFRQHSPKPQIIDALETLVSNKLGFALFKEIERVKKQLSTEMMARLEFQHDPIRIREVITRPQFERMIKNEIREVEAGLLETLQIANMTAEDMDVVLRTGGSSMVPVFIQMLERHFGKEKIHEMHPLISIVGGLGIAAYEGFGPYPVYAHRYPSDGNIETVVSHVEVVSGKPYEVYLLHNGEPCYIDQDTVFKKIPLILSRLPAIRPAQADYQLETENFLEFELAYPSTLYVAFTGTASSLPNWLRGWELTDDTLDTWDEWVGLKRFKIYRQDFPAGKVTLGSTRAYGYLGKVNLQYMVFIQAQSA